MTGWIDLEKEIKNGEIELIRFGKKIKDTINF